MWVAMRARTSSKSRSVRVSGSVTVAVIWELVAGGWRSLFARRRRRTFDFDQRVRHDERGDGHSRPGGRSGRRKELPVYAVHRREVVRVGEKHRALGDILHRRARECKRRLHVLERLARLTLDAAVGEAAPLRLRAHHARKKQQIPDAHRRRENARPSTWAIDHHLPDWVFLLLGARIVWNQ